MPRLWSTQASKRGQRVSSNRFCILRWCIVVVYRLQPDGHALMPTRPQVEEKLRSLDYDSFLALAQRLSIGRDHPSNMTDVQWREHHTSGMLRAYDGNEHFKKPLLRVLDLPTDEESQLNMQAASTDAAVRSATAAEQALEAALRSARAAEKSETHARSSKTATWITVVLTSIAVSAAVLALLKSFHMIGD
ncbi:MAG: hypothetical protein O7D91_18630 [Planctomycetota bacterium]|nr:hypothetical protein [Planctomycetota bacterium]